MTRFYLEEDGASDGAEIHGPPISPGLPEPGTGQVFVSFEEDIDRARGMWQCDGDFVMAEGTLGTMIQWGLSQPAENFYLSHLGKDGGPVEIFPMKPWPNPLTDL